MLVFQALLWACSQAAALEGIKDPSLNPDAVAIALTESHPVVLAEKKDLTVSNPSDNLIPIQRESKTPKTILRSVKGHPDDLFVSDDDGELWDDQPVILSSFAAQREKKDGKKLVISTPKPKRLLTEKVTETPSCCPHQAQKSSSESRAKSKSSSESKLQSKPQSKAKPSAESKPQVIRKPPVESKPQAVVQKPTVQKPQVYAQKPSRGRGGQDLLDALSAPISIPLGGNHRSVGVMFTDLRAPSLRVQPVPADEVVGSGVDAIVYGDSYTARRLHGGNARFAYNL